MIESHWLPGNAAFLFSIYSNLYEHQKKTTLLNEGFFSSKRHFAKVCSWENFEWKVSWLPGIKGNRSNRVTKAESNSGPSAFRIPSHRFESRRQNMCWISDSHVTRGQKVNVKMACCGEETGAKCARRPEVGGLSGNEKREKCSYIFTQIARIFQIF